MLTTFARLEPPPPLLLSAVASGAPQLDVIHHCKAEDLLAALPDGSIDLVVTSPPYDNLRRYNGFTWDFERIARETYRVLKPGGVLVWVVGDKTLGGSETLSSMRQALYFVDRVRFLMHDTMIWDKAGLTFPNTNRYYQVFEYMFVLSKEAPRVHHLQTRPNTWAGRSTFNRKRIDGDNLAFNPLAKGRVVKDEGILPNIWRIDAGYMKSAKDPEAFDHPAIFPEELARRHILTWSNPGDIVLDYFGGSGTTAKVARALGRRYITCDISNEYVQLMKRRLATPFTLPLAAAAPDGPHSRAAEQLRLALV